MKKIILLSFIIWGYGSGFSQSVQPEVIASAGEYFEGSNESLSWTLGESITETFFAANNKLTQGFQQSSYTITLINENHGSDFEIIAYPNPAKDNIWLEIREKPENCKGFKIELLDLSGKVLADKNLYNSKIQINLNSYNKGVYILKVTMKNGKASKSFKILKH